VRKDVETIEEGCGEMEGTQIGCRIRN